MADYKKLVTEYLDQKGIKYDVLDEWAIRIHYSGENHKSIAINVIFDEDGEDIVQLKAWDIANFKDKQAAGMIVCNQMNLNYRWVTFCIDDDKDVCCTLDAYIDEDSCGFEVLRLILRMVSIIDKSYPDFMKALWRD